MTPDARAALDRAGLTRRQFVAGSGALIVAFAASPAADALAAILGDAAEQPARSTSTQLDSWIAVAADGTVTAYTGKCELGQGLYTAQLQLIAEELVVPIDRIRLIQCDTQATPDQGTTSGSQSHPANFNRGGLALAAATAREALMRLASTKLGAPLEQLVVGDGIVWLQQDPVQRVAYGDLVGGRPFSIPLDRSARRRPAEVWSVLGRSVPRVDMADMATGRLEYVHNVRVAGILHGGVVRPPEVGASVTRVNAASVERMPGVVKVVVRKNFVGVVAEKPWQAIQAARRLEVQWSRAEALPSSASFHEHLRTAKPSRDSLVVDSGNVDAALEGAATVVRATYLHPYQMHGAIGGSCAVADVRGGRATVWSASQAVHPLRSTLAAVLGFPLESVRVVFARGAGCYGINGADTASFDAAVLAQDVGRPVRVQLTRQDEMAWENYGLAFVVDQRVALDRDGAITAWDCETWSPSRGGRPGYDAPGNVVTGMLLGFEPAAVAARSPAPRPTGAFANNGNFAPSYVAGCVGGICGGTGTVKSERVLSHVVPSPFFTGPLRSPSRLQNTFAHESFMDEIAARVRVDPVEYRVRHLADERLIEVVRAAAKAFGWTPRVSPRSDRSATGVAKGRGLSCVLYEGDNGYCAIACDVDVDQSSGAIAVKRIVVAQDCGPVSNPDGVKNQIEGGVLQGMSRALGEEVTWDDRKVTSVDWRTYRSLSLGAEAPRIDCVLINRFDKDANGAGETAITAIAAAIGNAVFDATGARLRQVPFTPERVKAALTARATAG